MSAEGGDAGDARQRGPGATGLHGAKAVFTTKGSLRMFIKVTTSGPRRYVQLVEAYRDGEGRPKQRTIATLGRLDQINSELESVIRADHQETDTEHAIDPVVVERFAHASIIDQLVNIPIWEDLTTLRDH